MATTIEAIKQRREDLRVAFVSFLGKTLEKEVFTDLVARLLIHLPVAVSRLHVEQTCRCLLGQKLTKEQVLPLINRMAGNTSRLVVDSLSEYRGLSQEQNVLAEIKEVQSSIFLKEKTRIPVVNLTLEVFTGDPAGITFTQRFSASYLAARRQHLGFAKRRRRPANYPQGKVFLGYVNPKQLFGFHVRLKLTYESCKKSLRAAEISSTATQKKHNQLLLKRRLRIDWVCKAKWSVPCYDCPFGVEYCQAACRPKNLVVGMCLKCGLETFLDTLPPGLCTRCAQEPGQALGQTLG